MKKPLVCDIIGVSNPTIYLLTKGALSLQANTTTKAAASQVRQAVDLKDGKPLGYWVKDEQGRIYHPYTEDELPLKDFNASGKPRPWKKHKINGQLLSAIYDILADEHPEQAARFLERSRRISDCAPFAEFEVLPDGQKKLHHSSFCRCRLCPMCQWRRSLKLGAQVRAVVSRANAVKISRDGAPYGWLLLTVTVQNVPGEKLSSEINHIHRALNNLTKCARWRGSVKGWLRATEVTRNFNRHSAWYGTYHPHMHLLLCVNARYYKSKEYIKKAEWLEMWKHYAGLDYDPIIDIETVKTVDGQSIQDLPAAERAAGMGKACAEVSKYATKPSDYLRPDDLDLSAESVFLFDRALENRRMTSWGGVLKETAKALQLDDIETGDLIHVETESEDETANKLADYVTYWWQVGAADYIKTSERRGDSPAVEHQKQVLNKKQVHARRRVQAGQGVQAKAKKDAEKAWRAFDADPEEIAEIFGGDADEA